MTEISRARGRFFREDASNLSSMSSEKMITSPHAPDVAALRAWLENMIKAARLVELVLAVITLVTRMRDINTELTKRLAHFQRKRPRSETLERLERQLVLPGLIQPVARRRSADESGPEKPKRSRKGRHPGRGKLPAHAERLRVFNPVPPALRVCPVCGSEMTTVGHSMCEILELVPARLVVIQRMDERVACPHDDAIVSAPTPPEIVERGKLGPTLIVEAVADKFLEHTPIERQCERWARAGFEIAPQTLGRSVAKEIDLLTPIAKEIHEQTRAPGLLGTDATGIPVLDPTTAEGIRSGAMTCWTNARWVSFFYTPSANTQSVRDFLGKDLCRMVQCDGTAITNCIERAGGKRPGCWGHGRRRLVEAARGGDSLALDGVKKIARLFEVEKASLVAGDNAEARRRRRAEHSQPLIDELRAWIDENRAVIPPKTPLGQGLGYLHRQWQRLTLFLGDGNIELTNNRRERELRRLVQGRKNWLFTWLDLGGERTAAILTIVASCIAHDINPRAYLHCATKPILGGWPQSRLRDLLPDRILGLHPELYVGDLDALPGAVDAPALPGHG